jgi:hypothetical protein
MEPLVQFLIVVSVIAWMLSGLAVVLMAQTKQRPIPTWAALLGPFALISYALKFKESKPRLQGEEQMLADLRAKTRRHQTESASASIGRISHTEYPPTRMSATPSGVVTGRERAGAGDTYGFFHYFIIDVTDDNRIIATSLQTFEDLPQGGYRTKELAINAGRFHLESIEKDPEHEVNNHIPILELRVAPSSGTSFIRWIEKLKEQKFPLNDRK